MATERNTAKGLLSVQKIKIGQKFWQLFAILM